MQRTSLMNRTRVYNSIFLLFLMGFVFFVSVQSAADDQKSQAERVRTHYRNGIETFVKKSKKYSKKGREINKKVLNESISDEAVIRKAIHFIRTNYIRSLKKSFDNDQSLHLDTIDNKKGYRVSGIPLSILVLRGRIGPFREYEKLTDQIADVQLIKLTINAIAQKSWKRGIGSPFGMPLTFLNTIWNVLFGVTASRTSNIHIL